MLELSYHQLTKHFILTNNTTKNYFNIRIQYKDPQFVGGMSDSNLAVNDQLIWYDSNLFHSSIQAELLATTLSSVCYIQFSELGSDGKFQVSHKKSIPKLTIIDIIMHDVYNLHPPLHHELTSTNQLLQDFINLIFAFIDTEYRKSEAKWSFGKYLELTQKLSFEKSDQNAILYAKCVVLMDFLKLTQREMATILLDLEMIKQ